MWLQALGTFVGLLQDAHAVVRDSAAWVVGHIADLLPSVIDHTALTPVLTAFFNALDDEPRVAKNVCWVCVHPCLCCTVTHSLAVAQQRGGGCARERPCCTP